MLVWPSRQKVLEVRLLMSELVIAIPSLTRYDLLSRLCHVLDSDAAKVYPLKIVILDNGGGFLGSHFEKDISQDCKNITVELRTPEYNIGVAGSWNLFVREYGQCIIANDDVTFSARSINAFLRASSSSPETVIFENDDPVAGFGFSTFFVNDPSYWLSMGGFDELFNPAYFEDSDCRYRLRLIGRPALKVHLPDWSHDNSSTLRTASKMHERTHWCTFYRNRQYYILKWGGLPGKEKFKTPFVN